jgi:hypothetical protein
MEKGKPGYKWGSQGKCYTYIPGDETSRKKAKQKAYIQGAAIGENMAKEIQEGISNKSWASVDKSKLPKSAFLWIEGDGKTKAQWHLPYKDEQGNVNLGALRAIAAAVAGARTGKPMKIPSEVRKKIDNLLKKYKIGKYAEKKTDKEDVVNGIKAMETDLAKIAFIHLINRREKWVMEYRR